MPIVPLTQSTPDMCEECRITPWGTVRCDLHLLFQILERMNKLKDTNIFLAQFEKVEPPTHCSKCGRDLHGYKGPECRYCDGTAE